MTDRPTMTQAITTRICQSPSLPHSRTGVEKCAGSRFSCQTTAYAQRAGRPSDSVSPIVRLKSELILIRRQPPAPAETETVHTVVVFMQRPGRFVMDGGTEIRSDCPYKRNAWEGRYEYEGLWRCIDTAVGGAAWRICGGAGHAQDRCAATWRLGYRCRGRRPARRHFQETRPYA